MSMPEPGTQEYEDMIEFMRQDLASGGALTKIIMAARKAIEDAGKNFDEEFAKWLERRKTERRGISSWKDISPAPRPIKFRNIK
jgi:hypothetical protein